MDYLFEPHSVFFVRGGVFRFRIPARSDRRDQRAAFRFDLYGQFPYLNRRSAYRRFRRYARAERNVSFGNPFGRSFRGHPSGFFDSDFLRNAYRFRRNLRPGRKIALDFLGKPVAERYLSRRPFRLERFVFRKPVFGAFPVRRTVGPARYA